jgi:3-oxoacyl-(acyl-carrier-protein) synthase
LSRIFVTGIGVISALGNTVTEHREALMSGKCGITPVELVDSKFAGKLPCGEIKISTSSLAELLKVDETGVTRTALLALYAFSQAVEQAGLSTSALADPSTVLSMALL